MALETTGQRSHRTARIDYVQDEATVVFAQVKIGTSHHVTPIGSSVRPPDIPILAEVNRASYFPAGRQQTGSQGAGAKQRVVDGHGLKRRPMINDVHREHPSGAAKQCQAQQGADPVLQR